VLHVLELLNIIKASRSPWMLARNDTHLSHHLAHRGRHAKTSTLPVPITIALTSYHGAAWIPLTTIKGGIYRENPRSSICEGHHSGTMQVDIYLHLGERR
jgi:hypothetical protein